jgi:hypothetical protein
MGNEMHTDELIKANKQYSTLFTFPAGIELIIPEIAIAADVGLPPWRVT